MTAAKGPAAAANGIRHKPTFFCSFALLGVGWNPSVHMLAYWPPAPYPIPSQADSWAGWAGC